MLIRLILFDHHHLLDAQMFIRLDAVEIDTAGNRVSVEPDLVISRGHFIIHESHHLSAEDVEQG